MLTRLILHNFVIVEHIEIALSSGFCVLTGETGAGKSLFVGALALLAGGRAGANVVRPAAAQAQIEAVFDIGHHPDAQQYLRQHDLTGGDEEEHTLLVRRVIGGRKSVAYINGHLVTLTYLAELMSGLIDICGQHAHYSLCNQNTHAPLLDSYAGADVQSVSDCHRQWRAAEKAYQEKAAAAQQADETRGVLEETLAELNALEFSAQQWQQMNEIFTRTTHTGDLLNGCDEVIRQLQGDDATGGGVMAALANIRRRLEGLQKHDAKLESPLKVLSDVESLSEEVARDITHYAQSLETDPQMQAAAEQFISACHHAARKYRVADPAKLGEFIADCQREYDQLPTAEAVERFANDLTKARKKLDKCCKALTRERQAAAKKLCREVNAMLHKLAMPKARLSVLMTAQEFPTAHGNEKINFQIITREGMPPGGIGDVASGGELSRLGLAMQMVTGKVRDCAVLVFDEVDAGVGGSAAAVVGQLLRHLGGSRQVLCVTHLAQVAAKAHAHWQVGTDGKQLAVKSLTEPQRVEEIARMQSGQVVTDSARRHAAELLDTQDA